MEMWKLIDGDLVHLKCICVMTVLDAMVTASLDGCSAKYRLSFMLCV